MRPPGPSRMEEFYQQVWALVRRIPRGRVMTYGQVADVLGFHGRARAVGFAMKLSPPGVPWHRVVSAQGIISKRPDRAGMEEQRRLLEAEGVPFDESGRMALARSQWEPS